MRQETHIELVQSMAEDQSIRLFCENPLRTYDDYIRELSWYWALPRPYRKGWLTAWIRCLTTGLDFGEL